MEVLSWVGGIRTIINYIVQKNKNWMWPVMRGNELLRKVMEVRMLGKRGLGRSCIEILNELFKKNTYGSMKWRTEDWLAWRIWTPKTYVKILDNADFT